MVEGIVCGNCPGITLTEEHFKECPWVNCVCHHPRSHHDPREKGGCAEQVDAATSKLCDCPEFNPSVDFAGYINSFSRSDSA